MNKPAAVLYTDFNLKERNEVLEKARAKITSIPGVQILEGATIVLEPSLERSSMCIRFMSSMPVIDTANGVMLQQYLKTQDVQFNSTMLCMAHMDLGDFMVTFGDVVVEKIGVRCADTGVCHHGCTETCFRKDSCVPLSISGLDDKWQPKSTVVLTPRERQLNHDLWALQEFYRGNTAAMDAIADCRKAVCRGEVQTPDMIRPLVEDESTIRETTYVDDDETKLFNGMWQVKNRVVNYRGFSIVPKLDFGQNPYRSHANVISTGWVITKNGCNAMPGATWDSSLLACRASIDIWIESGFNAEKYWELMEAYRY